MLQRHGGAGGRVLDAFAGSGTSLVQALESGMTACGIDLAATVSEKLRAVGVDTDKMVDVAKEQATELQRLIVAEIQERPLRALGVAAAVGLFVGFLSAR